MVNETAEILPGSGGAAGGARSLERAIGAQLRQIRRRADLSIADLASAAGISAGMVSKIENGQISPSLSTLDVLAGALAVPITAFFATYEDRRDSSFVKAGQGVAIERRGT